MPKKSPCANCKYYDLICRRDKFKTGSAKWRYFNKLAELWQDKIMFTKDLRILHPCGDFCHEEILEYRKNHQILLKNTRNIRRQKYIIAHKAWIKAKAELLVLETEKIYDQGYTITKILDIDSRIKIQKARVFHLAQVRAQRLRKFREVSKQ